MRKPLAACLAGTLVVASVQAQAAAPAEPLKVARPDAVKGIGPVVIGAFNVGFLFESVDNKGGRGANGGLMGAFGGTTKAVSTLVGVTPAMMQQITDAAYEDFKAQLAAKGFTIVDSAGLFSGEGFARVKPAASPFEASVVLEKNSKGRTSFYKPTALPGLVMLPGDFAAASFSGMGMAMTAGNTQYGMASHAKATGQAVIDVVYLIDFSDAKRPGAFSFGGIKVNSGMSVTADYSRLNLIAPSGKQATITVRQPVAVEGDFVTMADASSGFDKTSQAAGNVLGGLAAVGGLGGLGFGKTRKFAFTAKPGAYEAGATKAATLTNSRLVDQLAALR